MSPVSAVIRHYPECSKRLTEEHLMTLGPRSWHGYMVNTSRRKPQLPSFSFISSPSQASNCQSLLSGASREELPRQSSNSRTTLYQTDYALHYDRD